MNENSISQNEAKIPGLEKEKPPVSKLKWSEQGLWYTPPKDQGGSADKKLLGEFGNSSYREQDQVHMTREGNEVTVTPGDPSSRVQGKGNVIDANTLFDWQSGQPPIALADLLPEGQPMGYSKILTRLKELSAEQVEKNVYQKNPNPTVEDFALAIDRHPFRNSIINIVTAQNSAKFGDNMLSAAARLRDEDRESQR